MVLKGLRIIMAFYNSSNGYSIATFFLVCIKYKKFHMGIISAYIGSMGKLYRLLMYYNDSIGSQHFGQTNCRYISTIVYTCIHCHHTVPIVIVAYNHPAQSTSAYICKCIQIITVCVLVTTIASCYTTPSYPVIKAAGPQKVTSTNKIIADPQQPEGNCGSMRSTTT